MAKISEGIYILRRAQVAPQWGSRIFQGKTTRARFIIQRQLSDSKGFARIARDLASRAINQRARTRDQSTRARVRRADYIFSYLTSDLSRNTL